MQNEKRIAVLGGSFNPPTLAHAKVMATVMEHLDADMGIYVPSSDAYVRRKCEYNRTPFIFTEDERFRMLSGMLTDDTKISTCEYGDTSKGRTDVTLRAIAQEYPNHEIWFVMGSDKIGVFPKWRLSNMLDEFWIAVVPRYGAQVLEQIRNIPKLAAHVDAFHVLPEIPEYKELSSTNVQHLCFRQDPAAREYVTEETYEIIKNHIHCKK